MTKKRKPFKNYPAHIPMELWDKIVDEFKNEPMLGDRKNSYNRIINKALINYFKNCK